jgi:hypothetical protein
MSVRFYITGVPRPYRTKTALLPVTPNRISVCLVRTRLGPRLLPWVPQQTWESGACALLGCFMCGFSVLIENKRRRGEMALYVAPRAL